MTLLPAPLTAARDRVRDVADAHPRTTRLLIVAAITVAVAAAAPLLLSGYTTAVAVATGAITGAIMGGGLFLWRSLIGRLGKLTSIAALAVIASVVLTGIALALPHCPGGSMPGAPLPGRCSAADVGTWMTIGVVLPVAVALFLGGPIVVARLFYRVGRMLYRFTSRHSGSPVEGRSLLRRLRDRQAPTARRSSTASGPATKGKQKARRRARAARRVTRRTR